MTFELLMWAMARVAGLAGLATLSTSLLTGLAIRMGVLDWLGSNRTMRSLHEYTTILWVPLGALHVLALLLDQTARIGPLDVLVPFLVPYGAVAIGLGTVSLQVLVLVTVTALLRRRMESQAWQWLHRLSYVAYALIFLHSLLAGSDVGDPVVAGLTWATAGLLALLTTARVVWGRLPA
ncbi:MAG TPA: ferric reductase-like transmembrane domain-containing protein [Candidatus Dormibacteraeota bacterium]|nr:ferric reductase-like transmembrane domain-containing protein [Candidatus Dormibacteraeota bacterium]